MPTVEEYVKAKAVLDPLYWGKVYTPDTVTAPYAPHHADLMTLPEPGHAQARSVWRGSAKTTLVRIFAVWLCEHRHVRGVLWVRAGWGDCLEDIDALEAICEARGLPYQANMLRGMVFVNGVPVWFRTPRKKVRGLNHEGIRPDLLLIDDLEDRETAHSEDQTRKIGEWLFSDAMQTGEAQHPLRTVMYGTPITPTCLISQALRQSGDFGAWDPPLVVPIENEQGEPNWPGNVDPTKRPISEGGTVPEITWATEFKLKTLPPGTLYFKPELTIWRTVERCTGIVGVDPAGDGDDATGVGFVALTEHGLHVVDSMRWEGAASQMPLQVSAFVRRQREAGHVVSGVLFEANKGAWQWPAREVRDLLAPLTVQTRPPKLSKGERAVPVTLWQQAGQWSMASHLKGSNTDTEVHTFTLAEQTVTGHDDEFDAIMWAAGTVTKGHTIRPKPVEAAA